MPRVPVYGQSQPGARLQQRLDSLPNAYQDLAVDARMFGLSQAQALESAGRGLGNLADTAFAITEQKLIRANETEAAAARTALNEFIASDLYGENGYFQSRGQDAVQRFPQADAAFSRRYQGLLEALPTAEAQRLFRESTEARVFQTRRAMGSYVGQQRTAMQAEVANAELSTAMRLAQSAWNDPALVESTLTQAEDVIRRQSQALGHPDVVTQDRIDGFREGAYDQIAALAAQQSPDLILSLSGGPQFQVDASQPRGIRNNNALNIERSPFADRQGAVGDDGRFARFETPAAGIAAAAELLQIYQSRHGLNTIAGIIGRWAPAGDGNDVSAYAAAVSRSTGFGVDQELNLQNPATMQAVLTAMIEHENGQQPYGDDLIAGGVAMAGIGEMPEGFDPTASGPALVSVATMAEPPADAPAWWRGASPEARAAAWRTADQFRRQQQTAARAVLGPRLQDEETMQLSGVAVPAASQVSRAEIGAAYDAAEADQIWQDVERVREAGARRRQVAGLHPSAQQALLDEAEPVPGADFGHQQELYNGLQAAIAADHEMRQQPARYVANHVPTVMEAWGMKEPNGAIGELSPDEMRTAMQVTLQAQADIGIPEAARVPMLEQAAAGFVMQWQAETDMGARLDSLSALTIGLNDEPTARRVIRQLSDAGMPADMAYVLDIARDPGRRQNALDLMFALTAPIEAPPTEDQRRELRDELNGYWDASAVTVHLRAAFELRDPRLAVRSQDERAMFERVAERHMATYGDADAAIEHANQTLFGAVSTLSDPQLAYITYPADLDAGMVQGGLERLRQELITIERGDDGDAEVTALPLEAVRQGLQRQADILGEGSVTGSVVVDDQLAMAYIRDLRFNAVWVNDGDENYVLLDPTTGLAVPGVDTETYSFSTQQILEAEARRIQSQIDQRSGEASLYDVMRGRVRDTEIDALQNRLQNIERQMLSRGVVYN